MPNTILIPCRPSSSQNGTASDGAWLFIQASAIPSTYKAIMLLSPTALALAYVATPLASLSDTIDAKMMGLAASRMAPTNSDSPQLNPNAARQTVTTLPRNRQPRTRLAPWSPLLAIQATSIFLPTSRGGGAAAAGGGAAGGGGGGPAAGRGPRAPGGRPAGAAPY